MASLKDGRKYHEVKEYTRANGTKVAPHVRTAPTKPVSTPKKGK